MSRGFSEQWLEELKAKNDIVSVLNGYINLQSKGKNYWACCPFHHEKTASFCVYPMEQIYHCYGCKEHGDVIKFVQKIESVDFMQACEILAKNAGMEMPTVTDDESIAIRKKQKDTIMKVLDLAYKHYEENLYKPTARIAQEYIKQRKLTKKELDKFHIGYSSSWTEMLDYLKSKGISYEDMKLAGIAESKNNRFYDVMGERLIFPIFNIHDECVGFSARSLVKTDYAKYKNSSNSIVFDKSKNLYGINELRKAKQANVLDYAVLVEGQMDVIAMHKAGFSNAVASLGTAFTLSHCRMLKNITDKIVICLDGDGAGQKATLKTIDVLNEFGGFDVKAVKLPNNNDPDEFLKTHSVEELKQVLDNAIDWVEFKINANLLNYDLSKKDEKARFVNTSLSIIDTLKTSSEKQIYLDLLRKISGIPIDVLRNDLSKEKLDNLQNKTIEPTVTANEDGEIKAIKFILASLCYKKEYANFNFPLNKYLINDSYIKLYDLIKEQNKKGETFRISMLYDHFDMDNEPNLSDIINYNFNEINNPNKYYDECVWKIRENYLKNKIKELTDEFKSAKDIKSRQELISSLNEINKKLKNRSLED